MKQGRLESEISLHLYAIHTLLASATTSELSTFTARLRDVSTTNCGWIMYEGKPLLMNLLSQARSLRRKHGIYKI